MNNLSLNVNIQDAGKILAIISGPKEASTLSVLGELSNSLQERAPKSIVRIGDYPRNSKEIAITVVLSRLTSIPKVEELYTRAELFLKRREEIEMETKQKIEKLYKTSANIPSLDQ